MGANLIGGLAQVADRRDLWTTFRDERVRQRLDYFFHNANSAIRKSIWRDQPFDEKIRGVEDREWGKRMIAAGSDIVYEPGMRAYHQHGIHQGRDEGRAKRVAEVIEVIRSGSASCARRWSSSRCCRQRAAHRGC